MSNGYTDPLKLVPADQRQPGTKSAEEIAKMTPAERWEYTRRRSQETSMPPWKDPRDA
jgi:hypothetical protein